MCYKSVTTKEKLEIRCTYKNTGSSHLKAAFLLKENLNLFIQTTFFLSSIKIAFFLSSSFTERNDSKAVLLTPGLSVLDCK